ncbi:putative dynamin-binding protein-like isoform X1 [Penaeus vannamei]|uniref:Putative dynamin-binding protein-like isoform X1 n=1 Tax=Penaeus vannamei TaxID=6689 RepID=A0A3R7LXA3_PENVA|nr:putative dynamin-binding protein-like isoform X1 [Penaeus vannamei]
MDMRSVLIKPVQRVLKYPLFLDRLVSETAMGHPDFKDLMEAKTRMANVAKDINEYTKRLDLINKYRAGGDQSLQSKMQRVSMHSVVKKSARISAMVSEMLGIMSQTKDPEFDEEVAKFRCVQKAAQTLAQDVSVLLQGVIARHKAEMDISRNLAATLLQAAATPEMESIQRDSFIQQRVIQPAKQLVSLCEVPERLIQKRYHKMLDYDNAQYKLDKNKDATKTRILEEELSQMKGTYEALNTQLMMELPILTRCGSEVLSLATRSLVAARMYLQGHLAKLYLQLAQKFAKAIAWLYPQLMRCDGGRRRLALRT